MDASQQRLLETLGDLPITEWLPDETLFSLCSRHHRIAANVLARTTSIQLFGHARNGTQHDFTPRIDAFITRTHGFYGTNVESIIREHTILPFYLAWRTSSESHDALQSLAGDRVGLLKQKLGLLAGGFRAHHPLKACVLCARSDLQRFGVAYWHLSHQYPGVWVCPKHECLIQESMSKSTGVGRFLWHLPSVDALYAPPQSSHVDNHTIHLLISLAQTVISAARLPAQTHIDYRRLLNTYLQKLEDKGFTRGARQIALSKIAHAYLSFTADFHAIAELDRLSHTEHEAKFQVGKLLRTPRSGVHPLHHLILILWLFEGWSDFWSSYQRAPTLSRHEPERLGHALPTTPDLRYSTVIHLMREEGYSAHKAATTVGIDHHTAVAWATQARIVTQKRSRLLTKTKANLIRDLTRGGDKATIASKYHVSVQTITRVLMSEVGLQSTWGEAQRENRQQAARSRWEKLERQHPSLGVQALRLLEPAIYSWLYRNDRNWLNARKAHIPRPSMAPRTRVNWLARDARIALLVQDTALALFQSMPERKVTLQLIYQALPELKPLLGKLDRLPLTLKTLNASVSRRVQRGGHSLFSDL